MAKKLDFGKFKELLMTKGERVGLVAAAAIGGLLLVWGVLSGMAANSKDYSERPLKYEREAKDAMARGKTLELPKDQEAVGGVWGTDPLDSKIQNPLAPSSDISKTNKRQPHVIQPTPVPHPAKSEAKRTPQGVNVVGVAEIIDPADPEKKKILTVKQVQIDYLLAGVRGYQVNFGDEKVSGLRDKDGKATELVDVLIPQRLVVVHAVYDFEKQLKEFAEAYGTTVDDILGKTKPQAGKIEPDPKKQGKEKPVEDLSFLIPKVLGMEIVRYEYAPGKLDDPPKKTPLYQFSADEYSADKEGFKKFNHAKSDKLNDFFKRVIFEEEITEQLVSYHQRGLMTPLPRLLTGTYPELRLQGITKPKPGPVKGDAQPPKRKMERPPQQGNIGINIGIKKKPNPKQPEPEVDDVIKAQDITWKELEEMAAGKRSPVEQFRGDFELLDPYGDPLQKDDPKADPNARPKRDVRMGLGPQRGPKQNKDEEEKIGPKLIRFIDVLDEEAAPGTTYMYSIQVYLYNPYYKKADPDLNPDWTKSPVLKPDERSMTGTPPITIPQEYFFYAANQDPTESKIPRGNDIHEPKGSGAKGDLDSTRVAVQIQKWMGISGEHQIGDWVVVERLLVRRGDPIGRRSDFIKDKKFPDELGIVMTEIPFWDSIQGGFRLPTITKKVKDKKDPKVDVDKIEPSGIPMTFLRANPPDPVLVDFEGGKRDKNDKLFKNEESNYEMLLIGPDGKLFVRNSGVDSLDKDRIARYEHWRDRVIQARKDMQDGQPNMGPGQDPKKVDPRKKGGA